jgi:hypothetical protein
MKQLFTAFLTAMIALTMGAWYLSAQAASKRHLDVTVTDPRGRFVTGLEQQNFAVVENGAPRAITDFSGVDTPVAIALLSDGPLPDLSTLGLPSYYGDEWIQATSVEDAVRQLAASKNQRKAILNLTAAAVVNITVRDKNLFPTGIQSLQTNRVNLVKAVMELHTQYHLEFESSTPSASVAVTLKPPAGLPPLELSWQ